MAVYKMLGGSTAAILPPQRRRLACTAHSAPPAHTRRDLLALLLPVGLSAALPVAAGAVPLPPPPSLGDCTDCAGELNETLNACTLASTSCVSTNNDDESHFAAPWQYDASTEDALSRLIDVATGGIYQPGLIQTPFGLRQQDVAAYIAGGVAAVFLNGDLPEQPKRQQRPANEFVPFDGVVAERRASEDGTRYVRITFGTDGGRAVDVEDPAAVIDAEFLFLPNDNIVNIRALSRTEPPTSGFGGSSNGELALSFTQGLVVDRNVARRRMEALRSALRWDIAPVLTDFDPKFNPDVPAWVDRIFRPFEEPNNLKSKGVIYPAE